MSGPIANALTCFALGGGLLALIALIERHRRRQEAKERERVETIHAHAREQAMRVR